MPFRLVGIRGKLGAGLADAGACLDPALQSFMPDHMRTRHLSVRLSVPDSNARFAVLRMSFTIVGQCATVITTGALCPILWLRVSKGKTDDRKCMSRILSHSIAECRQCMHDSAETSMQGHQHSTYERGSSWYGPDHHRLHPLPNCFPSTSHGPLNTRLLAAMCQWRVLHRMIKERVSWSQEFSFHYRDADNLPGGMMACILSGVSRRDITREIVLPSGTTVKDLAKKRGVAEVTHVGQCC